MSEQRNNGRDRRGTFSTLFDPKTFPTLIPVLLAVGSAFIALDRMVHRVSITQEQHAEKITDQHEQLHELQKAFTSILVLKTKLENALTDAAEQKRLQMELNDLVREMKQMVELDKSEIAEIKRRLRQVERDIDKLTK